MRDFPEMAVGIGEIAGIAAPERLHPRFRHRYADYARGIVARGQLYGAGIKMDGSPT